MKFLAFSLCGFIASAYAAGGGADCKCYPDDDCWPSKREWDRLTRETGGRLSVELPPGLPCFPTYEGEPVDGADDPDRCAEVTASWTDPDWVADLGTWPMLPFWSNSNCYPSNAGTCSNTCDQGVVPTYVIKATQVSDIQAGVNFAREHNLRLIVRNTGHDFMGRSVGWGALVVNTHRLNDIELVERWNGPDGYRGKAVIVGAGVMGKDLYAKVWAADQDVVAGECPTVGVAGGYVQGGGQGPLSGVYGLASDNALEFTVVLSNGKHVTANSRSNPDLFWALKGGGPGTYGVVTSAAFKTHDRVPVTGMSLNIVGEGDTFWEGWKIWHTYATEIIKHGMYVWYAASPGEIIAQPFVAPNLTKAEVEDLLQPMLDRLDDAGVSYTRSEVKMFPNFGELYEEMWYTAFHAANGQSGFGGRLIAVKDVEENGEGLTGAFRYVLEKYNGTVGFGGHLVNPGNAVPDPKGELSAVHPVWREAADVNVYLYFLEDCLTAERRAEVLDQVTFDIGEAIRKETPNSAVYSNEGDINEPEWQDAFWGPVYPRLVEIKEKYDGDRIFWTKATPGSEEWELVDERLCKAWP